MTTKRKLRWYDTCVDISTGSGSRQNSPKLQSSLTLTWPSINSFNPSIHDSTRTRSGKQLTKTPHKHTQKTRKEELASIRKCVWKPSPSRTCVLSLRSSSFFFFFVMWAARSDWLIDWEKMTHLPYHPPASTFFLFPSFLSSFSFFLQDRKQVEYPARGSEDSPSLFAKNNDIFCDEYDDDLYGYSNHEFYYG